MILVVPCFNEGERLDADVVVGFLIGHPWLRILFVDDGSTDTTRSVLRRVARRRPTQVDVFSLEENRGKGEAVRLGLLEALTRSSAYVGYWDADLATPLGALGSFLDELERDPDLAVVMGSRVQLLGRSIRRHAWRHYLGRVAASVITPMLGVPVYDTQCGAKLLRVTPDLAAILDVPFVSRWLFDVELLGRIAGSDPAADSVHVLARRVREVPLESWTDVRGSRIRTRDVLALPLDLARVWWRVRSSSVRPR